MYHKPHVETARLSALILAVLCCIFPGRAEESPGIRLQLFNKDTGFSINTIDFLNYLQVSSYTDAIHKDSLVTRLNFGYELPVLGLTWGEQSTVDAGVAARCHLYLFPENAIFHVDNLFAALTVFINARISPAVSVRLYPVYHVSSHFVDGHGSFENQKISNEMVYLTGLYLPIPTLQVSAGYGYYYHAIRNQQIHHRFDLDLMYSIPLRIPLTPFFYVKNNLLATQTIDYGMEAAAGAMLNGKNGLGLGVTIVYFRQPHPGQYFGSYESGIGVNFIFKGL